MSSVNELQAQVEALSKRLDDLSAKEAIRDCIYRINRGLDRIDPKLLGSGFHPDAKIQWGTPDTYDLDTWLEKSLAMQHKTQRVQHLVGNILIEIRGDAADVESYEIGRHLTPLPDGMKDLIIASRYVDKFSRRKGVWKIDHRIKVGDWIRVMEGTDPLWDNVALKGLRDANDVSMVQFGRTAFHRDA